MAESHAVKVRKARLRVVRRPEVRGSGRLGSRLVATKPAFDHRPRRVSRQWLRDGRPIKRATGKRYVVTHRDVGHRIWVRWTARTDGFQKKQVRSRGVAARHRVAVRRTVTYSVETRGLITASLPRFRKLAQRSYEDARGWRAAGIRFRRVARGGNFTLVLAEPSWLPRFSPVCSVQWSCRVGRYVVINQTRWQQASPAWNAAGGSLRDYRHMVVNHETGHWLGHGHRSCPGPGAVAPVMQQQSKGLSGCRFNPFPTRAELGATR